MGQDDVRPGEVLSSGIELDHEAPVVSDELEAERTDRGARFAAAGRGARHIKQMVREVEVAGLDQLYEPLTVSKRFTLRVAEHGVSLNVYEPQRRPVQLA